MDYEMQAEKQRDMLGVQIAAQGLGANLNSAKTESLSMKLRRMNEQAGEIVSISDKLMYQVAGPQPPTAVGGPECESDAIIADHIPGLISDLDRRLRQIARNVERAHSSI